MKRLVRGEVDLIGHAPTRVQTAINRLLLPDVRVLRTRPDPTASYDRPTYAATIMGVHLWNKLHKEEGPWHSNPPPPTKVSVRYLKPLDCWKPKQ